jgi:hypothetical protein
MSSRVTTWILVIILIIIAIVLAVFIWLYATEAGKECPTCPTPVEQYIPNVDVATGAIDCVDSATCTYTTFVTLKEASDKCVALGAKCPAFSWNPDTSEMKVGTDTATTAAVGVDFYISK